MISFDEAFGIVIEGGCPNQGVHGPHALETGWCPKAKQEGGLFWSAGMQDGKRFLFTNWLWAIKDVEAPDQWLTFDPLHGWTLTEND